MQENRKNQSLKMRSNLFPFFSDDLFDTPSRLLFVFFLLSKLVATEWAQAWKRRPASDIK